MSTPGAFENPTKDNPFYDHNDPVLNDVAKRVFRDYVKIPDDQVVAHVKQSRDRAWQVCPYPCVGLYRTIVFDFAQDRNYPAVLERVKNGDTFLDLACALGQDLRLLIADGAPPAKLYGSDLRPEFFDAGYDLFRDKGSANLTLIAADGLAESSPLDVLAGQVDIIHASMYFHLFDIPDQRRAARRALALLRKTPGSMVVANQNGSDIAEPEYLAASTGHYYRHSPQSNKSMWEEVGREVGLKLEIESYMTEIVMTPEQKVKMDELKPLGPVWPDWLFYTVRIV